jgi:hypothetical protein
MHAQLLLELRGTVYCHLATLGLIDTNERGCAEGELWPYWSVRHESLGE